jgi:hypothetical protein
MPGYSAAAMRLYHARRRRVKKQLKTLKISQRRAALQTHQSPALVSMVLADEEHSLPCIERLEAFIAGLVEKRVARRADAERRL